MSAPGALTHTLNHLFIKYMEPCMPKHSLRHWEGKGRRLKLNKILPRGVQSLVHRPTRLAEGRRSLCYPGGNGFWLEVEEV